MSSTTNVSLGSPVTATTRRFARAVLAAGLALFAAGCMVQETRPLPKLTAVQATEEIPQEQLLDVGIRLFDDGIPEELENDPELAEKKGVWPDIRRAEARYIPNVLRTTLEGTGHWGAVRVVPPSVEVMDVMVNGRIVESTGYSLALDVEVSDATGRRWFEKRYEQVADTASYRDGPGRARDPYQNVYVNIANDMLEYRRQLRTEELVAVRRVSQLRFAADLAPAAFKDYLATEKSRDGAKFRAVRLPAEGDPIVDRVERIRERDQGMVDTVSDHYASFAEKMDEPYDAWRRATYDEIEAEQRLKRQATTRKVLGAAAVLGAILIPSSPCASYDRDCARMDSAARAAAIGGGVMGVMSGIQKGKEARMHTDALKEITGSFQAEAQPMVVDVEGRTLKLTGSAEAQYAEWRKLLHELYQEETGLVGEAPVIGQDGRDAAAPAEGAAPVVIVATPPATRPRDPT